MWQYVITTRIDIPRWSWLNINEKLPFTYQNIQVYHIFDKLYSSYNVIVFLIPPWILCFCCTIIHQNICQTWSFTVYRSSGVPYSVYCNLHERTSIQIMNGVYFSVRSMLPCKSRHLFIVLITICNSFCI